MSKRTISRKKRLSGFTLSETIMSMFVVGILLAITTGLLVASLKYYYWNTDKLQADRDLRAVTDSMAQNGSNANYFKIYQSFTDYTPVAKGATGDMAVFVYYDPVTYPEGNKVNRIVCYYQETAADGTFPIRIYDSKLAAGNTLSSTPLVYSTALLPASGTLSTNKKLAENFQDISGGAAAKTVFLNFFDKSVIVRANVYYKGTLRPNVSNTYNFTVTPRG